MSPEASPDYVGIAAIIAAVGALITTICGQVVLFMQMGKLHDSVNGQTQILNENIRSGAFAKGKAVGVAAERANPQIARPPVSQSPDASAPSEGTSVSKVEGRGSSGENR